MTFEKEDLHKNEVMRDLNTAEAADKRWQSSMEQLSKNTDDFVFKGEQKKSTSADFTSPDYTVSPFEDRENMNLSKKLQQKIEQLKQKHPSRYTQYLEEKPRSSFPIIREEAETVTPKVLPPPSTTKPKSQRAVYLLGEEYKMNHRIVAMIYYWASGSLKDEEVLRHFGTAPFLKSAEVTLTSSPSFLDKARYFLSSVNNKSDPRESGISSDQQVDNSATVSSPNKGCSSGFLPLWLSFANSVGSKLIDSSYVEDFKSCKNTCADETCTSLTYFNDGQCMTNVEDGGVHLRRPTQKQHSARTDLKFCYPENINSYRGCTTFDGFRDYTLTVEPREVFDGLPPGYEGLKLCIELCVLSTQYKCRSAVYLTLEGTCSLNDRDSTTSPTRFERSDVVGQLYFENGCNTHANHAQFGMVIWTC
ncbi:PAN domain protein [Oesophagostomum dentatum]|uniref:PAN domain protein n=1 Tax=Oesophagostomum dentatum TaxID=61180 RepID=A0A0B1TSF3_OESDE|nr:PAN domain protein [Oesophagostomum dentatum]